MNDDEATIFSSKLQLMIIVNNVLSSKSRVAQHEKKKLDHDVECTTPKHENFSPDSVSDDSTFKL